MQADAAGLTVLVVLICLYAAAARPLARWSITGAMVFTAAGIALGGEGLGWLPLDVDAEVTKLLTEATLALLLFSDAATVDARAVSEDRALVGRMLGVGLPLAIVGGALLGWWLLPELGWAGAALLAAVVAPTDAALGLAVFTNRAVPSRVRRVLNVESGVNDGLAAPVVAFFVAVVAAEEVSGSQAVGEAVTDIVVGVGVGIGVGALGAALLLAGRRHGTTTASSEDIGLLALAALAYVAALAASGNGFVAAFVGGLSLGAVGRGRLRPRLEASEAVSTVLSLLVWTIFGAVLAAPVLVQDVGWRPVLYAIASLAVVRTAAVAVALAGSGTRAPTRAFMGWFGPRGLASVVFALLVVIELEGEAPGIAEQVTATATWTVLLSVVLHGLSAGSLGRRYGAWVDRLPADAVERRPTAEPAHRPRGMAGRGAG